VPEAKRPDPKRRSPASRPAKTGKSGKPGDTRGRPRPGSTARRDPRRTASPKKSTKPQADEKTVATSIRKTIADAVEQQSEQRFGSAARRAAILAAVVCVLTLTIAGPVRTYFAQRTEMHQLKATEARLRSEIAELEEQKAKLADPVYIAAQARERLGFVKPGDIPYQVQLPPGAEVPGEQTPEAAAAAERAGQPWYAALWHTIADEPHNVPEPTPPPPGPPPPGPPPPAPAPGG
jgi:cell division protein FtsB